MESITLDENTITYVQKIVDPKEEGKIFRTSEKAVLAIESYPEALKIVEDNPQEFKRKAPSIFDHFKDWLGRFLTYFYSF